MEPKGSSPCSQSPPLDLILSQRLSPGPRRFETFRNKLLFYGEGLLDPRPTTKVEDHPLSADRHIFAATLRIWRPSLHPRHEEASCCGDMGPT
jgi:hypothetical protein